MFIQIDEEVIKKVEEVTFEKFHKVGNLIPAEEVEGAFEDLLCEIDRLKEELEDEQEQRAMYFKPKSVYEINGVREDDF